MIPLIEINAAAERYQVPAETIEKDYVICWILHLLAKSKIKKDFIFFGNSIDKNVIRSYTDLPLNDDTLSVMSLNTIFANKLGLLIDRRRNEPRDVFDIWFLLQRREEFDFDFAQICKIFNEKYGYHPSLSVLIAHLHNQSLKQHWETRIKTQIAALPDIKEVIRDITQQLNLIFAE